MDLVLGRADFTIDQETRGGARMRRRRNLYVVNGREHKMDTRHCHTNPLKCIAKKLAYLSALCLVACCAFGRQALADTELCPNLHGLQPDANEIQAKVLTAVGANPRKLAVIVGNNYPGKTG